MFCMMEINYLEGNTFLILAMLCIDIFGKLYFHTIFCYFHTNSAEITKYDVEIVLPIFLSAGLILKHVPSYVSTHTR